MAQGRALNLMVASHLTAQAVLPYSMEPRVGG